MFQKVKNVNVESAKKRSKLLVFRRAPSSFLSKNAHEWGHQGGLHFLGGARIDFVWNTNCFPEHELNTNCSRIVQKLMRHLMSINGETVLVGSAPFLNPF